jgi:hypothetical protein
LSQMKIWALLSFMACGIELLLVGCSGGHAPVVPAQSPLAGNWLIVGPMPLNEIEVQPGFRLAMTVDVLDNHLFADGYGNSPCGNLTESFVFPAGATGTIATDGTFSLQTLANSSGVSLSIQGMVPKANDLPWPGNYTFSITPPPVFGQGCESPLTGAFTAISFPLVNGVYAGKATGQVSLNGVSGLTSITAQMVLQQGVVATDSGSGKSYLNNIGLTGSIRVLGSPCFSAGVMNSSLSGVEGNEVIAQFTMDDGSTLSISGALTDPSESRIVTVLLVVQGGKCGPSPNYYLLSELDLEN